MTPEALAKLSDTDLERLPTDVLDRAAFGFSSEDIFLVPLSELHVIYEADIENAEHQVRTAAQARKVLHDAPPIDVALRGGRFEIEDGHHRYVAARILRRKSILATVTIKDNPILALRKMWSGDVVEDRHSGAIRGWEHRREREEFAAQNIPPEYLPLWEVWKNRFRGTPHERFESFMEFAQSEDGQQELLAITQDSSDAWLKKELCRHDQKPAPWVGPVPFETSRKRTGRAFLRELHETEPLAALILSTSLRYPPAGDHVDGLYVRQHIPNLSSIDGYFAESKTLSGVRVVPMSDLGGPRSVFYAADDFARSEYLADAIRTSGEINPLIIGVDEKGPFIIEGAHRFVALWYLKAREFPAVVVVGEE